MKSRVVFGVVALCFVLATIAGAGQMRKEDFNGSWTNGSNPPNTPPPAGFGLWTITATGPYWDNNDWHKGGLSSHSACARIDYYPTDWFATDDWLISPTFDLSTPGISLAQLKYWWYFNNYSGNSDTLYIKTSTNNGSSWSTVTSYLASGEGNVTRDISSMIGSNQCKIGIHMRAAVSIWYINYVGIDDIQVDTTIGGGGGGGYDIAITDITNPGATVEAGMPVIPTCTIKNLGQGQGPTGVLVTCTIDSANVRTVFESTVPVPQLNAGASVESEFDTWYPNPGDYTVYFTIVASTVPKDGRYDNNEMSLDTKCPVPAIHDVAASLDYVNPPDGSSFDWNQSVTPKIEVKNLGNQAERDFWVVCEIGTAYKDSVQMGTIIESGADSVEFKPWSTGMTDGNFTFTFYTKLEGDMDAANDTARVNVTVAKVGGVEDRYADRSGFGIASVAPNPARTGTDICYGLATGGSMTLGVYDVTGTLVRTLVTGTKSAGARLVHWDGRTDAGALAPRGVYFVRLVAGGMSDAAKLVVVR